MKSLALASKPASPQKCPVLGTRTTLFFDLLKMGQGHDQEWQYGTIRYVGTVRYALIFVKKYSTLVRYAFFVMVRVRCVSTERFSCNGTGTVRGYAI